jgi:DNA-binding transcriptional MerR regulator
MGRQRKYDREDLLNRLFDALVATPEGMTVHEITEHLEVPRHVAEQVIRALRLLLGDVDQINCVYRKDGKKRRYVLVGNLDDAKERLDIRLATYLANFETEVSILKSIVAGSDGRTREGRKARFVLRHFVRLQEDLADVDVGGDDGTA